MRHIGASFTVLSLCGALLACTTDPEPMIETVAVPAAAPTLVDEEPTRPEPDSKPQPKTKPLPKPTTIVSLPLQLMGLSEAQVRAALGEAETVLERAPGKTWIYRVDTCALDILFLFDISRDDTFVADYKFHGAEESPKGESTCLGQIARANDMVIQP